MNVGLRNVTCKNYGYLLVMTPLLSVASIMCDFCVTFVMLSTHVTNICNHALINKWRHTGPCISHVTSICNCALIDTQRHTATHRHMYLQHFAHA